MGCRDMTISGSHVILTWLGDYLLVMIQNKFYKLWRNYEKWGKIVPTRGHSFWSIRLRSGLVVTSLWQSLSFFQFKKTRLFMFWIQGQPDQFGNWTAVQSGPVAGLQISCQLDFETLTTSQSSTLSSLCDYCTSTNCPITTTSCQSCPTPSKSDVYHHKHHWNQGSTDFSGETKDAVCWIKAIKAYFVVNPSTYMTDDAKSVILLNKMSKRCGGHFTETYWLTQMWN